MQAIILAAGEGARLRPLTVHKPKPMVRVANKPILQHAVEALAANGIHEITLVLGHQRAKVQSYFGDGRRFGVHIQYAFQDALTGTTQALATAPRPDEPFLLLGGDNVVDAELIAQALAAAPGPAIVLHRSERPGRYGVATVSGNQITRLDEKPERPGSEWVSTGVYVLPAEFHDLAGKAAREGRLGLTEVMQDLIERGHPVRAVRSEKLWADAIYPWDLLRLNDLLLHRRQPPLPSLPVGVWAEGPVLVGENVRIGPGTYLGPGTVIGDNVRIGPGSVLEACLILDDVQLGAQALVQTSILAEGSRIGPRFASPTGPCHLRVGEDWYTLESFGSLVGEDCHLQERVSLIPGCLVGNRVRIARGRTLGAAVEDGTNVA